MNQTCPPIVYPETEVCSGRGLCIGSATLSLCQCNDPISWTGRGDLVFGSPTCAISVRAIQALHGTVGVLGLCGLVSTLLYSRALLRMRSKSKLLSKSFVASTTISSMVACSYGFYRVAYPEAGVGTDIVATVLFLIIGCAYNVAHATFYASLFVLAYARAGLSNSPDNTLTWFKLKIFVFYYAIVTLLLITLFMVMLGMMQMKVGFNATVICYLVLQSALFVLVTMTFFLVGPPAVRAIRQKAGDQASSGVLKDVLEQIEGFTKGAIASCLFGLTFYTMLAAWEGLRQIAYPYIFVSLWIQAIALQISATNVLTKTSNGIRAEAHVPEPARIRSPQPSYVEISRIQEGSTLRESAIPSQPSHMVLQHPYGLD